MAPELDQTSHEAEGSRSRAADHVFETLAREILRGELTPGSELASQRELSRRFGVSSAVMSQAIHRLEETGLVRVRHGGATTVLDPNHGADVRLLELQLELALPDDRFARAAAESQATSISIVLALAQRRITEAELDRIERCLDTLPEDVLREPWSFFVDFWGALARATRNPLIEQQMRWWIRLMQRLERRGACEPATRRRLPTEVYRDLIAALRARAGAPEFWLQVVTPLFEAQDREFGAIPPR
jgi:GntR family transcriptional repressor for pyruvate dehydrogenase complex